MSRIAVAGFQHETNSFSPISTNIEDFIKGGINTSGILKEEEVFYFKSREMNNATSGFLRTAPSLGMECIPLIWTEAEPSNRMSADTFNQVMSLLEKKLDVHKPYDGIFLDLHGAMIYGEHLDAETEILRRVRALVGEIPIVVALDLHGNIAEESFQIATIMVGYRTYPHVDIYETGNRCAVLLKTLLAGNHPKKAFKRLPFLMPTSSQFTGRPPLSDAYAMLKKMEEEHHVQSASIMLGFPPGDIECAGPTVFAYADKQQHAEKAVNELVQNLLEHEEAFVSHLIGLEDAVDHALALAERTIKPVILADVQDNPGGGSGSDSVWILEALLRRHVRDAAIGMIYDPDAALAAHSAGEGQEIEIGLGGKMMPGQKPHFGKYRVIRLFEGDLEGTGPMAKGMKLNLGKLALLEIEGIYISVGSTRIQAADQAVFTVFGLNPSTMKILVLKSFIHYRAAFEEIAGGIIEVDAPGAEFDDPSKVQYAHLQDGVRLFGGGPVFRRHSS